MYHNGVLRGLFGVIKHNGVIIGECNLTVNYDVFVRQQTTVPRCESSPESINGATLAQSVAVEEGMSCLLSWQLVHYCRLTPKMATPSEFGERGSTNNQLGNAKASLICIKDN